MLNRVQLPTEHQGPWVAAVTVAAVVLVGWLLSRWPGDRHWLTTVLAYAPQAAWPLLPLGALLWAAAARCWPAAVLDGAVLALALLGPGGLVLGSGGAPADGDIRVLSQNLFGQLERADEFALDRWRACDIICLQETAEDGYEELLPGYEQRVSGELRTFVRGRILSAEEVPGGAPDLPDALACVVEVRGRKLAILNVHVEMSQPHMSYPYPRRLWPDYLRHTVRVRELQYAAYQRWIDAQQLPVLVAGDLNTPPASRFHRVMRKGLTDCFAEVGRGFGYTYVPHGAPVFRIDYIWAGPGVQPIACETGPAGPSDHRMVVATVRL